MSPMAFIPSPIPSPAAHALPPHLKATLDPAPTARHSRVAEDDEWVLPDGQNLRKKFTFISTRNGEKLKNERVIINDFGTPMEIAIIKSSNELWREEFLRTLAPAVSAAARNSLRPEAPMASRDAFFGPRKSGTYNPVEPWIKALMKAPAAHQQGPLKTSDWELVSPRAAPTTKDVPADAPKALAPPTTKRAPGLAPIAFPAIRTTSSMAAPGTDKTQPAVSKAPAALPPHLRAMSDPVPAMKEPKVDQDGWVPGAQRKKFTFISTANGEQLKKEKVVVGSEISKAARVPVRGFPNPLPGRRIVSAPAYIPVQRPAQAHASTSAHPAASAPSAVDMVPTRTPSAPWVPEADSNRATVWSSAAATQVAGSMKKAEPPKVAEYYEASAFLKALELLINQGEASIDVCLNGVVTMRLSSSAASSPKSPHSLSSSPTDSTVPSSVSKDSKTSDFIREAIKRLNNMETMETRRSVIVGGPADYNRPVDTRPRKDTLKTVRTMRTTIVGGPADYNRPVDTRLIKVDMPQRVPSIVLGGAVVYQKRVDTRNVDKKFFRGAEKKEEIIPGAAVAAADKKDEVPLFWGDWPASMESRLQWRPSYQY